MNTIRRTDYFDEWMESLDNSVQGRIGRRIKRAERGNFGDVESVGDGVFEIGWREKHQERPDP
jgi:putative addiction module killer protein